MNFRESFRNTKQRRAQRRVHAGGHVQKKNLSFRVHFIGFVYCVRKFGSAREKLLKSLRAGRAAAAVKWDQWNLPLPSRSLEAWFLKSDRPAVRKDRGQKALLAICNLWSEKRLKLQEEKKTYWINKAYGMWHKRFFSSAWCIAIRMEFYSCSRGKTAPMVSYFPESMAVVAVVHFIVSRFAKQNIQLQQRHRPSAEIRTSTTL